MRPTPPFFVMLIFAAVALWLMLATFQVHQRWMAYERFAKLHATAIDPGFAGGAGAAVAYRQRVMVTAAEVLTPLPY